jgi:hypothetical protein
MVRALSLTLRRRTRQVLQSLWVLWLRLLVCRGKQDITCLVTHMLMHYARCADARRVYLRYKTLRGEQLMVRDSRRSRR